MPKLKVSSAARVINIPRRTLRGAISRGSVHLDPEGMIDTKDLERAGYTIDLDALAIEEARFRGRSLVQASARAKTEQAAVLPQNPYLFREQLALLREELDQAHTRQLQMLRILEQLSRNVAKTSEPLGASLFGAPPQPQIRQPILILLQDHPNGLTRKDIETALNLRKNLRHVLQGMIRDHLLVRLKPGIFAVAPEHRAAETEQSVASTQPDTPVRA